MIPIIIFSIGTAVILFKGVMQTRCLLAQYRAKKAQIDFWTARLQDDCRRVLDAEDQDELDDAFECWVNTKTRFDKEVGSI